MFEVSWVSSVLKKLKISLSASKVPSRYPWKRKMKQTLWLSWLNLKLELEIPYGSWKRQGCQGNVYNIDAEVLHKFRQNDKARHTRDTFCGLLKTPAHCLQTSWHKYSGLLTHMEKKRKSLCFSSQYYNVHGFYILNIWTKSGHKPDQFRTGQARLAYTTIRNVQIFSVPINLSMTKYNSRKIFAIRITIWQ